MASVTLTVTFRLHFDAIKSHFNSLAMLQCYTTILSERVTEFPSGKNYDNSIIHLEGHYLIFHSGIHL